MENQELIRKRKKRPFNWQLVSIMAPLVVALVGWAISLEVRMSKHESALELAQRVKNIEDLMLPMLADWKAMRELNKLKKELGLPMDTTFVPFASKLPKNPLTKEAREIYLKGKEEADKKEAETPPMPSKADSSQQFEEIQTKARNWAESQIRQSGP